MKMHIWNTTKLKSMPKIALGIENLTLKEIGYETGMPFMHTHSASCQGHLDVV